MELNLGIVAGGVLVLLALVAGLFLRFRSGRGKRVSSSEAIDLAKLKAQKGKAIAKKFGAKATLLQFSTEYCGICPGVSRQLSQLEKENKSLLFLEVDITNRLDLAAHFSITQTPTIFVLDSKGLIKFRVSGAPRPGILQTELEKLGAL